MTWENSPPLLVIAYFAIALAGVLLILKLSKDKNQKNK